MESEFVEKSARPWWDSNIQLLVSETDVQRLILKHAYMHYLFNSALKETQHNTHRSIPSNAVSKTVLFNRRSHWSTPWNENPLWWKDNLSTLPKVILKDCRPAKTKLNIPKVDCILSLLSVLEKENHHKQPMVVRNEKTI